MLKTNSYYYFEFYGMMSTHHQCRHVAAPQELFVSYWMTTFGLQYYCKAAASLDSKIMYL
jgi:hypothetical protein